MLHLTIRKLRKPTLEPLPAAARVFRTTGHLLREQARARRQRWQDRPHAASSTCDHIHPAYRPTPVTGPRQPPKTAGRQPRPKAAPLPVITADPRPSHHPRPRFTPAAEGRLQGCRPRSRIRRARSHASADPQLVSPVCCCRPRRPEDSRGRRPCPLRGIRSHPPITPLRDTSRRPAAGGQRTAAAERCPVRMLTCVPAEPRRAD
jgi:hypothetical protein